MPKPILKLKPGFQGVKKLKLKPNPKFLNLPTQILAQTEIVHNLGVAVVSILGSLTLDMGSIPSAAMLNGSFILATSAIHLITVVHVCLLGLTKVKTMLNSLIQLSNLCSSF